MARTVKSPEIRRTELLDVAGGLFAELGFAATSVDAIVRAAGVAKGTFYYYFRTKEDVLDALVHRTAEKMLSGIEAIANRKDLDAIQKLRAIFQAQRGVVIEDQALVQQMHLPQNREIHTRSNIETVILLGPVMARVVEEGVSEGLFKVDDALSTVQFILAGSLFLFDEESFRWSGAEALARLTAMVTLSERALGAAPGSLADLLNDATGLSG